MKKSSRIIRQTNNKKKRVEKRKKWSEEMENLSAIINYVSSSEKYKTKASKEAAKSIKYDFALKKEEKPANENVEKKTK